MSEEASLLGTDVISELEGVGEASLCPDAALAKERVGSTFLLEKVVGIVRLVDLA